MGAGACRPGEADGVAFVELRVEDGYALGLGREHVGVGVRDAGDQPVQPQATQVVGHLPAGVVAAEESGDEPAKALVPRQPTFALFRAGGAERPIDLRL
jgi:hypothetical protein